MSTNTPRTAAFLNGDHVAHDGMWLHFASTLERELAEAQADKRRMDWLEHNKDDLMFSWVQGTTVRAAIDDIISDVQDAVTQPADQ